MPFTSVKIPKESPKLEPQKDRQHNVQTRKDKATSKPLLRKLKIEQHEPRYAYWVNSGSPNEKLKLTSDYYNKI
jgi:hypothetical protein